MIVVHRDKTGAGGKFRLNDYCEVACDWCKASCMESRIWGPASYGGELGSTAHAMYTPGWVIAVVDRVQRAWCPECVKASRDLTPKAE
jgi:hypothetical protein